MKSFHHLVKYSITSSIAGSLSLCCGLQNVQAAETEADVNTHWTEKINLETHGFVSFGYMQTGKNNLFGDTTDGSSELTEMGLNIIARPADHWRIGIQLFARDLIDYDNGKPQLDWAYVDYRHSDEIGAQVGRVKFPLGLHNETWDVDAAHTTVFLPRSVYNLQLRDLFVSVDGAKLYGQTENTEYALYAGNKSVNDDAGFATYTERFAEYTPGSNDVNIGFVAGGMIAWQEDTIELRFSYWHLDSLDVVGELASSQLDQAFDLDYDLYIASAQCSLPEWTFSSEFAYRSGTGLATIDAINLKRDFTRRRKGAYINATHHMHPQLDLYLAAEYINYESRESHRDFSEFITVAAVAYRPLENWSLKAEFQYVDDEVEPLRAENPTGIADNWWVFALKTTVDF